MIILKKRPLIVERLSFNMATGQVDKVTMGYAGINTGLPKQTDKQSFDRMVAELGIFGVNGDNNNYYPNLQMSDIMPKAEDFVDIPFRFISAAIVGGNSWKASDFSQPGVLKASVDKLANKPLFTEHEQSTDNWAGLVVEPYWEDATTQQELIVPGGISGTARVDFKSRPNLARGLLMGAIYSNSVSVDFAWEPSHTFNDMDEFYRQIGQFASDKKMVRRVAVDIRDFYESSFVWLGADPFAKRKDANGDLVNIDKANVYFAKYKKEENTAYSDLPDNERQVYEKEKKLSIGFCLDNNVISLSLNKYNQQQVDNSKKEKEMNKQAATFILAFLKAFGTELKLSFKLPENADQMNFDDAQVTEMTAALSKLGFKLPEADANILKLAKAFKVRDAKGELTTVDFSTVTEGAEMVVLPASEVSRVYTELAKVPTEAELAANTKLIALGKETMDFKRSECVRLYKLAVGEKYDASVEQLMKNPDTTSEQLDGFLKQYGDQHIKEYAATCTKCGNADHVEMRSSMHPAGEDQGKETLVLTNADIADEFQEDKMFRS